MKLEIKCSQCGKPILLEKSKIEWGGATNRRCKTCMIKRVNGFKVAYE